MPPDSWTVIRRIGTFDFDVRRDPLGRFTSKVEAVDDQLRRLEREREDLAAAMRKARQMRRRAARAAELAAASRPDLDFPETHEVAA